MRIRSFLHNGLIFVCATTVFGGVAQAHPDSNSPATGGGETFATKADGMVSTVEGFLEVNDYVAAEKAALELTQRNPQYLKGWMLLGYCQSHNERYSESNDSYDTALELGADADAICMRKAYNHIRLGNYAEARTCYRRVLERDHKNAEALRQLGYLEGKLGNYDESAHYYRRILEDDPDNTEVIEALSRVEEKRGGNGIVKELLEKSLELDPDNTEALSRLGLILIKEKQYKEAVAPLLRLVTLEPNDAKTRRNLAVAYYQLGEKKAACEHFAAVKELGGDMTDLYGPLADCYTECGEDAKALAVIKTGIEDGVQQAWLYCMWGKMLEKGASYDAAISKFSSAARTGEEPWSTYAKKQIARQAQLKQRAEMMSAQGMQ